MNINKIFQKMAAEKGISTTEVRKEIQNAIDEGMKNPDPKVQEYWNKIPRKGDKPTPEEVMAIPHKDCAADAQSDFSLDCTEISQAG